MISRRVVRVDTLLHVHTAATCVRGTFFRIGEHLQRIKLFWCETLGQKVEVLNDFDPCIGHVPKKEMAVGHGTRGPKPSFEEISVKKRLNQGSQRVVFSAIQ